LKDQLGSRHATRTGIQDREVYRDAIDTLTLNPADATALETLRQGALERSGRQVVGRRGLFNRIPPGLRREYAEAMRALAANPSDANAAALLMTAPDVVRGRHHAGAIRGRVLRNVPHTHRQRYAEAVRILDTQVGDVNAALRTLQGLNLDMVQLRTTGVRGALRGITKANRHSNEMAAETARVNPNDERSLEVLAGTPGQLTDPASPLGRGLYGMRVASFGLSNSVGSRLYLNPIFDPASRQWQWDISTLDGLRNWIGGAGSVVFQWGNATGLGASVAKDFAARYRVHTGKDITVQEADAPQPASQAAEASASNTSGPVDTNRRPLATYGPNNTDRAFVRFLRGLGNTNAVTHAGVNDDGSPMVKPPVIKRLPQWSSWGDTVGMIGLTGADLLQGVAYASVGHWPLAATSLLKVVGDIGMFRGSQKDYLDEYRANHGMGPVTYYSKAFRWFNAPLGNAKVNPTKVSDGLIVRGLPPLVQLGAFTAVRVLADELARQLQPEESQQPTPDVPVDQTESPPAADPLTLSPDEYWSVEGAIERRAVSAGIVETREQRDQTNNKALAQLFQLTGVPG
jgi:hypothetical protein